MPTLLDGKILRDRLALKLAQKISRLKAAPIKTVPRLLIFQVGAREDSESYIKQKKIFAERIGAEVIHARFPNSVSEKKLLSEIHKANADKKIHGIIVQLPVPRRLDKNALIEAIDPGKDVDGLTSTNLKKFWEDSSTGLMSAAIIPATSRGVLTLLREYGISVIGKHAVVIGQSRLVGRPIALALLNHHATVTVAHKQTKNLAKVTKQADILVVAIGDPEFITRSYVKKGASVIDVGINSVKDSAGKPGLVGDVDFASVPPIAKAISPVPGGVGPMTVLSLFQNLVEACERQSGKV